MKPETRWSSTIHPTIIETYDVWYNCFGSNQDIKGNLKPLDPIGALQLALEISRKEGTTEVWIVCIQDNIIAWHWKDGKVIFPVNDTSEA